MGAARQKVVTMSAALLIIGGVALLSWQPIAAYFVRQQGQRQNTAALQQAKTVAQKDLEMAEPVYIAVPRPAIGLDVLHGTYNADHSWTLDRQHAFTMGDNAATPIIYGHNIPAVFRSLDGVAHDEPLVITDVRGQQYLFAYVGDITVAPTDTSILDRHLPNTVLLMTCTGSRFEQRRILQFRYIGTQPSVVYERLGHGTIA